MIGYNNRNGCGTTAVEHEWNLGEPEKLGKFLVMEHPTYEDAVKLVNGGIVLLKGEPKEYEHLDRYGEVIENKIHWNKERGNFGYDYKANSLITPKYNNGWKLPKT